LVIGDDPEVRIYVEALLESGGFAPLSAEDETQGFTLAHKEDPVLIILDIMMPEERGITMYRSLLNDPVLKSKPVIMLSALPMKTVFHYWNFYFEWKRSKGSELLDCIEMPPERDELLKMIQKHLVNTK